MSASAVSSEASQCRLLVTAFQPLSGRFQAVSAGRACAPYDGCAYWDAEWRVGARNIRLGSGAGIGGGMRLALALLTRAAPLTSNTCTTASPSKPRGGPGPAPRRAKLLRRYGALSRPGCAARPRRPGTPSRRRHRRSRVVPPTLPICCRIRAHRDIGFPAPQPPAQAAPRWPDQSSSIQSRGRRGRDGRAAPLAAR
jgi:hypothetical protein